MRYKIWDKQEDIYTLGQDENGKSRWTANEYIEQKAPWAANPNVKVIIGGGAINGTVFMEYEMTVDFYRRQGAAIPDEMEPGEALAAIEAFENAPPDAAASAEERIAAALEMQNLLAMPEE